MPVIVFMPASSHSCFASFNTTCMPFCTQQIAMPPPISPAPKIPTFFRGAGAAFKPGIFVVMPCAKKRCRKAPDCTLKSSFVNSRPSTFKPSWKLPWPQAASAHLMIEAGATMPFTLFMAWFKAISKPPALALKRDAFGTGRLEIGAGGLDNANFAASSTTLPDATASTTPVFCALSAFTCMPLNSIGKATSNGATRKMR
mmetsp:Transcript_89889/g.175958  ORF Transcript_89889/g.175958 Transcript_89889/m.175958 type:complete len:200 (+) Transcript_89889:418-1017(+)